MIALITDVAITSMEGQKGIVLFSLALGVQRRPSSAPTHASPHPSKEAPEAKSWSHVAELLQVTVSGHCACWGSPPTAPGWGLEGGGGKIKWHSC